MWDWRKMLATWSSEISIAQKWWQGQSNLYVDSSGQERDEPIPVVYSSAQHTLRSVCTIGMLIGPFAGAVFAAYGGVLASVLISATVFYLVAGTALVFFLRIVGISEVQISKHVNKRNWAGRSSRSVVLLLAIFSLVAGSCFGTYYFPPGDVKTMVFGFLWGPLAAALVAFFLTALWLKMNGKLDQSNKTALNE